MLSVKDINLLQAQNDGLIKQNKDLQAENIKLNAIIDSYQPRLQRYKDTLQEIKGVVTALYMNNWLQMNETARKSIQLLQELINKAEVE